MTKLSLQDGNSVTGLIPAAGRATRLGNLPYSKELLPVPRRANSDTPDGLQLAIENSVTFLLDCGIQQQHVVIAPAKQDIPDFLGDGERLGAAISYTTIADSPSVPHSLAAAYPSVATSNVVLVFPDIMFEPRAAIASHFSAWSAPDSHIMLALVPSERDDKVDIVSVDAKGLVTRVDPKPGLGRRGWTWVAAAWLPQFSEFMHRFVNEAGTADGTADGRELFVADILNAAITSGLVIRATTFPEGRAIDIGTPGDFALAWQQGSR